MNKFIQPYHYNFLAEQSLNLLKTNQWVNDRQTRETMRALIMEKISARFPLSTPAESELLSQLLTIEKSSKEVQAYLNTIKEFVIPFVLPTETALKKLFPKTKKLKFPNWDEFPLTDFSFYGWNDIGQQRKYLVYNDGQKFIGIDGTISSSTKTSICAICQTKSEVTLFMARIRGGQDGAYLNQGNYICYDSHTCNQHVQHHDKLLKFMTSVTAKK